MLARVREQLDHARDDSSVRALLLRINSPGGTVTASDIIYQELLRFKRERGVPVVAHFMGVAASGGYYVAMAADEVIAQPTDGHRLDRRHLRRGEPQRPDGEVRRQGPDAHRGRPEGRRLVAAADEARGARAPAGGARRHARALQAGRGGGTPAARPRSASTRSPTGASTAPTRPRPTVWSTGSAISSRRSRWRSGARGSRPRASSSTTGRASTGRISTRRRPPTRGVLRLELAPSLPLRAAGLPLSVGAGSALSARAAERRAGRAARASGCRTGRARPDERSVEPAWARRLARAARPGLSSLQ